MTPRYLLRAYKFIPRVKDAIGGNNNTYLATSAGTPYKFFTDTPELPPPLLPGQPAIFNWVLPDWFPRKAFFVRTVCVFSALDAGAVNLFAWIDPYGISYRSTVPKGIELNSDLTRQIDLLTWNNAGGGGQKETELPYPAPFDRDAGDKLVIELSASVSVGSFGFVFYFLQPNQSEPDVVGVQYRP